MTATVSILVARHDGALKIPKAALRFQPKLSDEERQELEKYLRARQDGGTRDGTTVGSEAQRKRWQGMPKVWILTPEGFLRPVTVRLGISDDQFTELLDGGLREGQDLVTGIIDGDGRGSGASRRSNAARLPRLRF
jgi:HlyD family secretion protein